jgi:hypothetical protein
MRRIALVLTVATIVALMLVGSAGSALALEPDGWDPFESQLCQDTLRGNLENTNPKFGIAVDGTGLEHCVLNVPAAQPIRPPPPG